MISAPLPYVLEDRSGVYNASDFDDIYDRLFLRIVESSHDAKTSVSMIYDMGRRSSRRRDSRHLDRQPSVVLQFGSNGALGNVHFMRSPAASSLPMHQYLRKATIFGGSLSRRFKGSDGREYRWSHRSVEGQEWSCFTNENHLVANYALKPPGVPAFHVSGNSLTIDESFSDLAIEMFTSLTIMRHIAQYNL